MKEEELQKQAWDFFQMQATLRLTTFNFYITIASLLATGLAASFKIDTRMPYLGVAFGLLLFLFSFTFWKLDERNRDLIKGAENTLKFFENKAQLANDADGPHLAKRFLREEHDTKRRKSNRSWLFWKNHYTYSECFRSVFLIFALAGLVGSGFAVFTLLKDEAPVAKHNSVEQGHAQPTASRPASSGR